MVPAHFWIQTNILTDLGNSYKLRLRLGSAWCAGFISVFCKTARSRWGKWQEHQQGDLPTLLVELVFSGFVSHVTVSGICWVMSTELSSPVAAAFAALFVCVSPVSRNSSAHAAALKGKIRRNFLLLIFLSDLTAVGQRVWMQLGKWARQRALHSINFRLTSEAVWSVLKCA